MRESLHALVREVKRKKGEGLRVGRVGGRELAWEGGRRVKGEERRRGGWRVGRGGLAERMDEEGRGLKSP
jgi:hypothetical protein